MAKNILLSLLLLLGLTACASPIPPMAHEEMGDSPLLYSIRIYRGQEMRFSGILVIQATATPLSYALLDSTGVTLISAEMTQAGQQHTTFLLGPVKKSPLPSLLATSLHRIFLAHSSASNCQEGLFSFYQETGMGRQRTCYLGPIPLWSVQQSGESPFAGGIYSQPGLQIKLVRMSDEPQ